MIISIGFSQVIYIQKKKIPKNDHKGVLYPRLFFLQIKSNVCFLDSGLFFMASVFSIILLVVYNLMSRSKIFHSYEDL